MLPPFVIIGAASRASADERIRADVVRRPKRLPRRADEIALERFLRRERHRVQHQIEPVRFPADLREKLRDLRVARNIAGKQRRAFAKLPHQFLDVLLQPLALIIENQTRPGRSPRLGDRPRDAPLVRHAENDANLPRQNLVRHNASPYPPFA